MLEPIRVSEADLAECPQLDPDAVSRLAGKLTPWIVSTVKQYNECAEGRKKLADKVREHNKKSQEKK